jgi:hypothetical protein
VNATLYTAMTLARTNRYRTVAANLAGQQMDTLRDTPFTTIAIGHTQVTQTVDKIGYLVATDTQWWQSGATSDACTTPGIDKPDFLQVTVSVSWPGIVVKPVQSQTILSPSIGNYNPYTGAVWVQIRDRNGGAEGNINVVLTGPTSSSQTTTPDGCAYFPTLTAGSYTVGPSNAGYVDTTGNPLPTAALTVTIGQEANASFAYDPSGSVALTLSPLTTGTVPAAVAATVANGQLKPQGTKVATGSGSPRTIGPLYPFTNGYQLWAGDCADADPQGVNAANGQPYYSGAVRQPALDVPPGGSAAQTVKLPEIDVHVTHNGTAVAGAAVTALHAADPASCTAGDTLAAGTTDATGTLRVALPYGTWGFSATKAPNSGTSAGTASLTPSTVSVPTVAVAI